MVAGQYLVPSLHLCDCLGVHAIAPINYTRLPSGTAAVDTDPWSAFCNSAAARVPETIIESQKGFRDILVTVETASLQQRLPGR